ncbi:hypothetical protein SAMD00019534_065200 [Acytostelium subglobosum LB1]|uniref:hypothetical protein n=1 Tax=Acytostelium subglobosum LB1 TaxID=1410327 RepID=UPI000644E774|nr:hypothetical protein SAMD00019534_065200 [Acytostelium subglobosum LB1]GAM23345.1 hypothetical protein SAMD00019534_065200 [Acytostelium subglobosum LB1]|eukprot:XP_012753794.1 hypothetical protein SAMD00019534_065200 [Acytostelium subglobosum LB1]
MNSGTPVGFQTAQYVIGAEDLSVFYFNKYSMDVSSSSMTNSLYLNSSKILPTWRVTLVYGSRDENQFYEAEGKYEEDMSLFVIPFTVPARTMTRQMQYYLRLRPPGSNYFSNDKRYGDYFGVRVIHGDLISMVYPNTSVINIISINGDEMPPMITSCTAYPSRFVNLAADGKMTIGWNITIEDSLNGFSRGVINVVSDIDGLERRFEITPANRTSGDMFKGIYQILFTVDSNFGNQTFTFLDIELFDSSMNRAQYITHSNDRTTLSPLSYLMQADKILEFNIQLTTSSQDLTPPSLVSMEVLTPTVDVGSHMRQVQIRLTISETGTGYSIRHTPAVYLTGYLFETFKLDTTFMGMSDVGGAYSFMATGQLPFGFASNTFTNVSSSVALVSVYGLVDNSQNLIGYSTNDLPTSLLDLNKTIAIKYTHNIPIIDDYSIENGMITIFGKNFGDDIALNDLTQGIRITKTYGAIVIAAFNFKVLDPKTTNISIQLSSNQYSSNIVVIQLRQPTQPIVTPTVICPGNPPCFNNGDCSSTFGCQCYGTWYGQDCSSESIPTTPTIIDHSPTTVYTYNISDETVVGDIEIVRVRILNQDGAELASYPLSQWNVTNLSAQSRDYTTKFGPSDNIGMIKVNVIWFTEDEDVKFAGDILPIKRNTIKYTITLSDYRFPSQLDSMQVVMRAAINTTDSNSCSVQQQGYVNGSQDNLFWMRVKVQSYSLYGHFIQKALVDGRVSTVTNVLVSDQSQSVNDTQSSQTMIGFNVRSFEQQAILDPDFHLLVDIDNAESNDGSICNHKSSSSSSKRLSTLAMIGIIVVCVVVVVAIITAALILIRKERRDLKIFNLIKLRRRSLVK